MKIDRHGKLELPRDNRCRRSGERRRLPQRPQRDPVEIKVAARTGDTGIDKRAFLVDAELDEHRAAPLNIMRAMRRDMSPQLIAVSDDLRV